MRDCDNDQLLALLLNNDVIWEATQDESLRVRPRDSLHTSERNNVLLQQVECGVDGLYEFST